ncbi:MAG TPA: hypothetical protein VK619_20280 [Pyrinomonadaceae bacterium]|nr:hypothetical protein [Pyrinomonadaceae bacterium]
MTGTPFIGLYPFQWIALITAVLTVLLVADALAGHYRSGFAFRSQYAPFAAPLLAVFASLWIVLAPSRAALVALSILLWLTFLTGFVGLGMHLRGFSRQMGGLYVTVFNWLEGPPAFAPALFAGFAAVGLVTIYLL